MECDTMQGPDGAVLAYANVIASCAKSGNSTCGRYPPSAFDGLDCIGPGPSCDHDGCDGSTLVLCQGGHEARYDCTTLGLGCFSDMNPDSDDSKTSFCGLGTECGIDYGDACKGSVLTYCNAGTIATLDCKAAGYGQCLTDASGTHCAP
jgi:hypothetical protein